MKLFKSTLLAGSLALLCACASTPEYRVAGSDRAAGYSQIQIETNRYRVNYRLNERDQAKAQSLALRRAAELTLENGYDTFELVSQSSDSETERDRYTNAAAPDRVVQRNCGLLGCSTSVSAAPRDPFSDSHIERDRNSVTVTLEIIMSDKEPGVSPSLYDASEVFANLS